MAEKWKSQAMEIIEKLEANRFSDTFLAPVDTDEVPDYLDIIKKPMCVNDIKERINIYKNREDFIRDMDLVWENACHYNAKDTKIFNRAVTLRKIYHNHRAKFWGMKIEKPVGKRRVMRLRSARQEKRKCEVKRKKPRVKKTDCDESSRLPVKPKSSDGSGIQRAEKIKFGDKGVAKPKVLGNSLTLEGSASKKAKWLKGNKMSEEQLKKRKTVNGDQAEISSREAGNNLGKDNNEKRNTIKRNNKKRNTIKRKVIHSLEERRVKKKKKVKKGERLRRSQIFKHTEVPDLNRWTETFESTKFDVGVTSLGSGIVSSVDPEDKISTANREGTLVRQPHRPLILGLPIKIRPPETKDVTEHAISPGKVSSPFPQIFSHNSTTKSILNTNGDITEPGNIDVVSPNERVRQTITLDPPSVATGVSDVPSARPLSIERPIQKETIHVSERGDERKSLNRSLNSKVPSVAPFVNQPRRMRRRKRKVQAPCQGSSSADMEREISTNLRVSGVFGSNCVCMGWGSSITSTKPPNQDRIFLKFSNQIKSLPGILTFGVCDGHGLLGHVAAEFVRDRITDCVLRFLHDRREKVLTAEMFEEALEFTLRQLNERLRWMIEAEAEAYNIVLTRSGCTPRPLDYGTTCVVAITDGSTLTVANVGDSKIMCYYYANGVKGEKIRGEIPLSVEHSLDNTDEVSRVRQNGGGVSENLRLYPEDMEFFEARKLGLTINMSRALGHPVLWKHGLSPTPEFMSIKLEPDIDYFLVAASDGLWDVFSSEEVGTVIHENLVGCLVSQTQHGVEEDIVSELIHEAEKRWKKKCYGDNISTIVVTIREKSDPKKC